MSDFQSRPGMRKQHQKAYARGYSANQIRRGELYRQPCEVCGAEPAECHHIDYSDPERVMWLCTAHHKQTHSQFGKPAPEWMADIRAAVRRIEDQRPSVRAARAKSPPADSK